MFDEQKFILFIKENIDAMHKTPDAEIIEKLKKTVVRNVSFFERKSLLAYLLYSFFVTDMPAVSENKNIFKTQADRLGSDEVLLWCNLSYSKKEDVDKFLDFISSESCVDRSAIKNCKKRGKFSFLTVSKPEAELIISRFKKNVFYENHKVGIRYNREK